MGEPLRRIFGIDLRGLGVLRIGAGILILVDLTLRLGDVSAFYTDAGTMPRGMLIQKVQESPWCPSLHLLSGLPALEYLLLAIAGAFACALIAGFRTRIATAVSWLLLLSLQYRNPMILQGGDVLMRLLLFWGMFLPWGKRFSLDSTSRPADHEARPLLTIAAAALLLQICFVYWFSARLKFDPAWTRDHTAVFEAFSLDHFSKPLGKLLLPYHHALRALTIASFWIEAAGPAVALLSGLVSARLRIAMVFVFLGFHLGMAACLELGLFPAICCVAWLAFMPPEFWDLCERRLHLLLSNIRSRIRGDWDRVAPSGTGILPVTATPAGVALRWLRETLAAVFLIYVFLWNLRTTNIDRFTKFLPASLDAVGWLSGTAQIWNMFAPGPLCEGGWFVMPARLANGREVDIFRKGAHVSWEKPRLVSKMYKNDRWRKYLVVIAAAPNTGLRAPLAEVPLP